MSDFELTTENVIDWLLHYKQDFVRVNGNQDDLLEFDNSKIDVVWFRRWLSNKHIATIFESDSIKNSVLTEKNYYNERKTISDYFFYTLKEKKWLSKPKNSSVNKLVVLKIAEKIGFQIPNYALINNKKDLIKFKFENNEIITKSIDNPFPLETKDGYIVYFTSIVDDQAIEKLDNRFCYSFFQKLLIKKFEIRVFVIKDKFYAMAIFNDSKEIDNRKSNTNKRKIPYKLSEDLQLKILALMNELNLLTASFDFVCDVNDIIYFLEINPVGQFGDVSECCNYHLEKEVAQTLIMMNNGKDN